MRPIHGLATVATAGSAYFDHVKNENALAASSSGLSSACVRKVGSVAMCSDSPKHALSGLSLREHQEARLFAKAGLLVRGAHRRGTVATRN